MIEKDEGNSLLKLYEIYDRHRDSVLWFLHELDARTYEEYLVKYHGTSLGRAHFTTVCGFFEFSGVLVNGRMMDQNLYFEVFNPAPFWERAKSIIQGMRKNRPHIYENFELLNKKRLAWARKREGSKKLKAPR